MVELKETTLSTQDLILLSEISREILSTVKLDSLLDTSIKRIVNKLHLLGGTLCLVENDTIYAKTIAGGPAVNLFLQLIKVPFASLSLKIDPNSRNFLIQSILKQKIFESSDLSDFTFGVFDQTLIKLIAKATGTRYGICIPLIAKNQSIGVLFFSKSKRENFEKELPMLKLLSEMIAIAIENVRLLQETEEKADQLSITNEKLTTSIEEINELRRKERDLVGVLVHEIKTPLTTIHAALELSQNKIKDKDNISGNDKQLLEKMINMAMDATNKERKLTERLLSFTRVEGGIEEVDITNFDITKTLRKVFNLYSTTNHNKNIKMVSDIPEKPIMVKADEIKVHEIADNLLSNALKYTDSGEVKISLQNKNDLVIIEVSDTGIGIDAQEINDIGKKYFRARKTIKQTSEFNDPGGTGLGIYVVMNYLSLMGSELCIESELGKGTKFSFKLQKV